MNRLLLFAIVSALLVGADSPNKPGDTKKDSERIQGRWGAVSYVEDGQGELEKVAPEAFLWWLFKGDKVTWLADVEGASAEASFMLDSGKKPKMIDMTFAPAPGTKKEQRILGIYELEGDTFKICCAADGGPRPTEFKSKAGSKHVFIVFKKLVKKEGALKGDLAKLQGTWLVDKTVVDGKDNPPGRTEKIIFLGNKVIFWDTMFKDGGKKPEEQINFSIEPSKKPKTIDLTFPGAAMPGGKDALFARGIYASFSPDAKSPKIVTGFVQAKIWNATTRTLHALPVDWFYPVEAAAFSPDGQRLVTCNSPFTTGLEAAGKDARVRGHVRDVSTGKELATLRDGERRR